MTRLRRFFRPEPGYRKLSLYLRVVLINAGVLAIASILLAVTPATISFPLAIQEAILLGLGILAIAIANAALLRVAFRPLGRLVHAMRTIDLLQPGNRLTLSGGVEVREVIKWFNHMIDRLERERQESNRRTIGTREAERRRIGQELHDEIGQRLTSMLLQLDGTIAHASPASRDDLLAVQELARSTLDEVGRLAWQLRPGILDDLGLLAALEELVDSLPDEVRGRVALRLEPAMPHLGSETELATYRIAQEGLTNALRHSQASRIRLELTHRVDGVRLVVSDDGCGIARMDEEGPGLRGMRERALMIGARLQTESTPEGGVLIQLDVPLPA